MKASLGKRAFVPMRLLDQKTVREAQKSLLFEERQMTRMEAILADEDDGPEAVIVNEYDRKRGGVSLPRAWAMKHLTLDWSDNTVSTRHGVRIPEGRIKPRDDRQAAFFDALCSNADADGPQDILANADTGSGKSIAGIKLGVHLGYRTLIVVDSNKIANGWLKNFRKLFGDRWTQLHVGRVQQDQCEYRGKAFSIALAQSLAVRNYGRDFYRAFGCLVLDEVQVFGGPHFAPILSQFPARVRAGVTAENRSGAFGKLVKAHLGDTRIKSKQEVLQPIACLITNKINHTFYAQSDGAILTGLSQLRKRNNNLASLIKKRGYDRDRNVLVLSNRTAQLAQLMELCKQKGIPADAMGLHAGSYQTQRFVIYYKNAGSTKRNRLCVVEDRNAANRALRQLKRGNTEGFELPAALYNRLQAGETVSWEADRESYAPSQSELDNITNSCNIIFATYEIFSKGVDVPRLDMGVEALPSGNLKQPLGRILRLHENKPIPEWYAICDVVELEDDEFKTDHTAYLLNEFFQGKTNARITALKKAKAKIAYQ